MSKYEKLPIGRLGGYSSRFGGANPSIDQAPAEQIMVGEDWRNGGADRSKARAGIAPQYSTRNHSGIINVVVVVHRPSYATSHLTSQLLRDCNSITVQTGAGYANSSALDTSPVESVGGERETMGASAPQPVESRPLHAPRR